MKDLEKKLAGDDDSDYEAIEGNQRTMTRLLARFGERTSLRGVQYINISKTWYAKLLWTMFFCGGLAGMAVHLRFLIGSYLNFAKQTKIQLEFDSIRFPAITLCNVNPVRMSKSSLGSQQFRDFVQKIKPENIAESIKKRNQLSGGNTPSHNKPTGQSGHSSPSQSDGRALPPRGVTTQNNQPPVQSISTSPAVANSNPPSGESGGSTLQPGGSNTPHKGRKKRSITKEKFNFTNSRQEQGGGEPRELSPQSYIKQMRKEFKFIYSMHDRETRILLGHSMEDMLMSCTFSDQACNASQFRIHPTSTFGNCYTLESEDLISYKSGPSGGLELILFLDVEDYINSIASGAGAQLQIHDTNTWPDPEVGGLSMSAAMETNVAMRTLQIERLNWPNDDCDYGTEFEARYERKYTLQACQLFCIQERIVSQCGCYDEKNSELLSNINKDVKGGIIPPCREETDLLCMFKVEFYWEMRKFQCPCKNPCYETSFQKISTNRRWPSGAYARLLVEYLCATRNETECEKYQQMDDKFLSQNFMKINIYFEDLNFELIRETRGYEDVQFASDVGGTVGLWVGLTILSVMEVFQFFMEILQYLYEKYSKKKKVDNTNVPNDNRVQPFQRNKV